MVDETSPHTTTPALPGSESKDKGLDKGLDLTIALSILSSRNSCNHELTEQSSSAAPLLEDFPKGQGLDILPAESSVTAGVAESEKTNSSIDVSIPGAFAWACPCSSKENCSFTTPPSSSTNTNTFLNHPKINSLSASQIARHLLSAQMQRVKVYKSLEKTYKSCFVPPPDSSFASDQSRIDNILLRIAYFDADLFGKAIELATINFQVVSSLIRALMESEKCGKVVRNCFLVVQREERDKLRLVSALHLEGIRLSGEECKYKKGAMGTIGNLLKESFERLGAEISSVEEKVREQLEEVTGEIEEDDEMEE